MDGRAEMKELTRKGKKILVGFLLLLLTLFLVSSSIYMRSKNQLVIGAKNNTENHLLCELLAQTIEKEMGIRVVRRANLDGTSICFHALNSGTIDAYFEYTGTAASHILKSSLQPGSLLFQVREEFAARYDLHWQEPLGFNNRYVLIARKDAPFSAISEIPENAVIALDPEFSMREEIQLLTTNYPQLMLNRLMDQCILFISLEKGAVDVISGDSTNAHLAEGPFKILEDDRQVLPLYEVAPVVRGQTLEKYPYLGEICARLKGRIDEEQMRQLCFEVEHNGKDIAKLISEIL